MEFKFPDSQKKNNTNWNYTGHTARTIDSGWNEPLLVGDHGSDEEIQVDALHVDTMILKSGAGLFCMQQRQNSGYTRAHRQYKIS